MTAIAHALIGASIAVKVPYPAAAGLTSIVTHVLCDAIPHWDLGTNWRMRPKLITGFWAIMETILAITGVYWLFSSLAPNQSTLMISIVASLLPDWLETPYYLMPNHPGVFYQIYQFQSRIHARLKLPEGVITQIIVVALFLFISFSK